MKDIETMPEPDSHGRSLVAARRGPSRAGMAALALLLAGLVAFFQFASGSRHSELGSHPDEAAHFVTGLMVRDYLASGFHESPLRYADEYYRHYPKIGLGNWPPLFYMAQAVWTLILPAGVGTVLGLMAALGVALALAAGWWLWREYGWMEAATGAVLLTALPLVQQYSNMVMAEMLSALLMFGAAGFFALYMEEAGWRWAIGFGVFAGLAMMTKGTGMALAFVPPLAILFTGRYGLLRRASLWVTPVLVGVIAGPWTWHFRSQANAGWVEPHPSPHFTRMAVGYYMREICVAAGGLLVVLALAGAVSLFLPKGKKPAIAVCSLALVLGVWIFQCIMPVGFEARHLMPAMPALMVLVMTGLHALTERQPSARPWLAAGLLAVFFGWPAIFRSSTPVPGYGSIGNDPALSPFRIPHKQWGGFQSIAVAALASEPAGPILVASDARGEGMFIVDMAEGDPRRPSYTVERASKVLASSRWSGLDYQSLYQTPEQVRDALSKAGIGMVVTDVSMAVLPAHEKLLLEAVNTGPSGALASPALRDGKESPGAIVLHNIAAIPK